MLSCIVATIFAGQLMKESIYTLKLARRGIDIRAGKEVNVLKSMFVRDVMSRHVETITEGSALAEMTNQISKSKYNRSQLKSSH